MTKYYVDAAIWRDLIEDRTDRFRPLGMWAFEFFRVVRLNKLIVLYSDFLVEELLKDFNLEQLDKAFSIISDEGLWVKVDITGKQTKEAHILKRNLGIPFGDALHTILARDNKAVLITRDHHFDEVAHIVKVKKPEDLI